MKKICIILLIIFAAVFNSCPKKMPEQLLSLPLLQPEPPLSVFWETATVTMNVDETRELRWNSSRPIQPKLQCSGTAAVITGTTQNGIRIRAMEGGMGIVSLFIEEREIICAITVNEVIIDYEEIEIIETIENSSGKIIIPYTKEYLSPGQETNITVYLDNGGFGDEMDFLFSREPGKNIIAVEGIYNAATVKAIGEGKQYLRISHPKAPESRYIVYDVLPPAPPPPPEIDVSESPMIVRKGETKPLLMTLINGSTSDREKFQFRVVENAYAIDVQQRGNILNVTGIAPGAGKIRIQNPAALRDYEVMVIVD
jgi:hypothetical protein